MEPHDGLQEQLDTLLSSKPSTRRRWLSGSDQREELEPLLGVADDLAHVSDVLPSPTFANDLEARLLARARRAVTVDAIFAGDAAPDAPTVPLLAPPDRPRRSRSRPARSSRRVSWRVSWRVWSSLAAAVLLALAITTFTIAAYASPGSALYTAPPVAWRVDTWFGQA